MNIPLARVEQITKLIPSELNITLDEALKEEPAPAPAQRRRPRGRRLLDFARQLEGTEPQRRHARRRRRDRRPAARTSSCRCRSVPQQGQGTGRSSPPSGRWATSRRSACLKMDFLGLRNLTSTRCRRQADRERPAASRSTSISSAARRRQDLRAPPARRCQGRVPARIGRHPRPAQSR